MLDTRLRDVPVSAALRGRLYGIVDWSDEELDWQLRHLPLPPGLIDRLQQIVPDEQLDERLRDVVLPSAVVARARIIPDHRRPSHVGRFALAASLLLAFSLGYWSSLGAMLLAVRRQPQPLPTLIVMDQGPLELTSPAEPAVAIVAGPAREGTRAASDGGLPGPLPLMLTIDRVPAGPAGQLLAEMGRVWDPAGNWMRLRWPVLGHFRPEVETLADLEMVGPPLHGALPPPLSRALDREFLYSRGTQPPLLTLVESARRIPVPLSSDTASFDRWQDALTRGRALPSGEIRAADFLAALDYRLPPADSRTLALRTAAGPSVFNPGGARLLQISAIGGLPEHPGSDATHLTIALDLSASMAWNRRLDIARQGILRALSQLRTRDRFSLVVFREQPFLLVSEAKRHELAKLYDVLGHLQPGGGANVAEALQQAIATTLDINGNLPTARRLVLITDSGGGLTGEATEVLQAMLREAADRSFRFEIFDVGDADTPDAQLTALAQAGGGSLRHLQSASQIRWSLIEILHETAPLMATDVQLDVDFNPQAVAAYRLIGHESPITGGPAPSGELHAQVHVGEELTALLEVWLYPNDEDDIATVQLHWQDAANGGDRRTVAQRISRVQFAPSFEGSSVSLQQAAIAAEVGEVLRQGFNFDVLSAAGYRYEPKPRDLQHVLQAARRANPQLAQRPDVQQLLEMVRQADQNSIARPPAQTRSGTRGIIAGRWRESKD